MFEFAFYLLFALLIGALLFMYRQVLRSAGRSQEYIRQNTLIVAASLSAWLLYIGVLSHTGIFRNFTPPPRIFLLLVLPAFAWMLWYFRTGRYRVWLQNLPAWQPPALQGFRIAVELLIWGVCLRGLGPALLSFEGRNFDVVAGISGPIVAWLLFRYGARFAQLAYYWNYLGLALLVNIVTIFITLAVRPQMWGFSEIPLNPDFGTMPYLLIAAVYMPVAVFLHFLSLHQLSPVRTKSRAMIQIVRE